MVAFVFDSVCIFYRILMHDSALICRLLLLGDVGYSAWLGQICTLPLEVLKSVLISHQIVHLCLREHRLLQILLIATHVKSARIKAKLVVIA